MTDFDREPWIGDARRLLEDSAQALDAASLSRLNRARHAALAGAARRTVRLGWFAAAGLGCTALLLLAVALQPSRAPRTRAEPASVASAPAHAPAPTATPASAIAAAPSGAASAGAARGDAAAADTDAADDSDEFYQDLEFYAWLDAQEGDGDG